MMTRTILQSYLSTYPLIAVSRGPAAASETVEDPNGMAFWHLKDKGKGKGK